MTEEPVAPSRNGRSFVWSARVVGALLILGGIVWMLATATFVQFLAIFGDCFDNCDGYWGAWAVSGRYSSLIVLLGEAAIVLSVAAIFFQVARIALAVAAISMLGTLVFGWVFDTSTIVLPVADVYVSQFRSTLFFEAPAAVFWLGGACAGLIASRVAAKDARRSRSSNPSPIA